MLIKKEALVVSLTYFVYLNTLGVLIFAGSAILCFWPINFGKNREIREIREN